LADVALAVLVSGSGTILEAMFDFGIKVDRVVADRPCRGLEVATAAGVPAVLIDRREFGGFSKSFDRVGFSLALVGTLDGIDVIAMAGFGTITTAEFHDRFSGRVLNTHPSLLPEFKGWHAVRDALAAGVAETGCTVHVATLELDDGPILAQVGVDVREDDSEASLHERIKEVERDLYPRVVASVIEAIGRGESAASVRLD
jgi:phosphoribosylglycinamide formyltransferase-1